MIFSKVFGTVEGEFGQDGARIKVVAFKRGGSFGMNVDEIKSNFPPAGFIFSPHFFSETQFEKNDLIEFNVVETSKVVEASRIKENWDWYILDNRSECNSAGYPLISISNKVFVTEFSIDQPQLKLLVKNPTSSFYLQSDNHVYGPFKQSNEDILPKSGTCVGRYAIENCLVISSGQKGYLLKHPESASVNIECFTPSQLIEGIRTILRSQLADTDLKALKKLVESGYLDGPLSGRAERAFYYIERLAFTLSELKTLASTSEKFQQLFEKALRNNEEEIRKEFITPFVKQKQYLERELLTLKTSIAKLKKEETLYTSRTSAASSEYKRIADERERLIADIKVHTQVNTNGADQRLSTFEQQFFFGGEENFNSVDEAIAEFKAGCESQNEMSAKIGQSLFSQLKDFRCILCDDIGCIIWAASIINNTSVIIQQVEPDWLKFQQLFENGLKKVWEAAHDNPDVFHFFVLQDINMAAIECFGRPFLDVAFNIRRQLPGVLTGWPPNLWVFGIPVQVYSDKKFGLPLLKETFAKWGAVLPISAEMEFNRRTIGDRQLSLKVLADDKKLIGIPSTHFFT